MGLRKGRTAECKCELGLSLVLPVMLRREMSYSLNSFKGVIEGTIIGLMKGILGV